MPVARGSGRAFKFIVEHVGHRGNDCLLWPMSSKGGYGNLGVNGKMWWAHRLMCILAHGEPPTKEHHAAHECGNPQCVNPMHIRWKSPGDNQRDRKQHGTKSTGCNGRLTFEDGQAIRALKGIKTYNEIAEMYGVSPSNITHIMRGDHLVGRPIRPGRPQSSGQREGENG